MSHPNYNEARKKAEELIVARGITEPVVPIFEIAEDNGCTIRFFRPTGELLRVAGFTDTKTKTIYVNESDPAYRQSFTVAHELGHLILGHGSNEYGVLLRNTHIETTPIEKEANAFASYLLMPEALLRKIMGQYNLDKNQVELLAGIFGVSSQAMKFRLQRLEK